MSTNSKYKLHSRSTPKNVVIGIILGVIAVVACMLICLLLWHSNRKGRMRRSRRPKVDLLAPEITDSGFPSKLADEAVLGDRREKPLPRIPSGVSMHSYATLRMDGSVPALPSAAGVTRPPLPNWPSRKTKQTPGLKGDPQASFTNQLPINLAQTPNVVTNSLLPLKSSYARPDTSSVGRGETHGRNSSRGTVSSKKVVGTVVRRPFVVVNVTDSEAGLGGPEETPDHLAQGRGRVSPFPRKRLGPKRSISITTPASNNRGKNEESSYTSSVVTTSKNTQKNQYSSVTSSKIQEDLPSTPTKAYMVQVPIPSSSPLMPKHLRAPLTLTASYPVSSIVVGNVDAVRRPDGSRGIGRMITMSVVVDESDSCPPLVAPEGPRVPLQGARRNTGSEDGDDMVQEVLEHYWELPPYTPTRESNEIS